MPTLTIQDLDDYERALATHSRVILFKHSPICPVSAAAHAEWTRFLETHADVQALFVDVIGSRPAARGLAEACGVAHASPQAILFLEGQAVWDASHGAITTASLAAAWTTTTA